MVSPLLAELGQSGDPKVPYVLLVGNTSIIPAASEGGRLERLLSKLSLQRDFASISESAERHRGWRIQRQGSAERALTGAKSSGGRLRSLTFFSSDAGRNALLTAPD